MTIMPTGLSIGDHCGHNLSKAVSPTHTLSAIKLTFPACGVIQAWLKDCFNAPPKCPLFKRWPDLRLIRRQRREACLTLLLTLIRHLDRSTLCFGFLHPNGQFQNLAMKHIVLETGLGQRRCERVIADLKQIQALEMKSPGRDQRPTLAFTERFVEWMLWSSSLWAKEHDQQAAQSTSSPGEARP